MHYVTVCKYVITHYGRKKWYMKFFQTGVSDNTITKVFYSFR